MPLEVEYDKVGSCATRQKAVMVGGAGPDVDDGAAMVVDGQCVAAASGREHTRKGGDRIGVAWSPGTVHDGSWSGQEKSGSDTSLLPHVSPLPCRSSWQACQLKIQLTCQSPRSVEGPLCDLVLSPVRPPLRGGPPIAISTWPGCSPRSSGRFSPILDRVDTIDQAGAECGVTQVTKASGKTSGVYFRWAANTRARRAITAFAHNARMQSPWAPQLYTTPVHAANALLTPPRIVARAGLHVIWACWHHAPPTTQSNHHAAQRLTA